MSDDRRLTLALALTKGIGAKSIVRIATRNTLLGRSSTEFRALPVEALTEDYGLTRAAALAWTIGHRETWDEAGTQLDELAQHGATLVTAADASYPTTLEAFDPDPPGVLYLYGNRRLLEAKTFTVLASRDAPPAALEAAESLAEQGVLAGEALVGGHDTPAYQRTAVVPLRWGAPRILVLDRGFYAALGEDLRQEPFRTARLWRFQFDPGTDLVLSAVPPRASYHRNANRLRDRLVGGLAARMDVVWSSPGGNVDSLARRALAAGRPVRVLDLGPNAREWRHLGATMIDP